MRRVWTLLLAGSLLLAGCAASPDQDYAAEAVATLQAGVLAVTEASASGDVAGALDRLDELQASLLAEYEMGTVSEARFASVSAAIALVRADLERLMIEQDEEDRLGNSDKPGKPDEPDKPDKPDKKD